MATFDALALDIRPSWRKARRVAGLQSLGVALGLLLTFEPHAADYVLDAIVEIPLPTVGRGLVCLFAATLVSMSWSFNPRINRLVADRYGLTIAFAPFRARRWAWRDMGEAKIYEISAGAQTIAFSAAKGAPYDRITSLFYRMSGFPARAVIVPNRFDMSHEELALRLNYLREAALEGRWSEVAAAEADLQDAVEALTEPHPILLALQFGACLGGLAFAWATAARWTDGAASLALYGFPWPWHGASPLGGRAADYVALVADLSVYAAAGIVLAAALVAIRPWRRVLAALLLPLAVAAAFSLIALALRIQPIDHYADYWGVAAGGPRPYVGFNFPE